MTEFDFVTWPNSTAETCKMTEFARTVNLNCLSLTKIKVYSPLDLKVYNPLDLNVLIILLRSIRHITFGQTQKLRFTVLLFGQVTKVFGLLYSVILQSQIWSSFSVIWTSLIITRCERQTAFQTKKYFLGKNIINQNSQDLTEKLSRVKNLSV